MKYSGITGASGYEVYYRIEKGSSISAWKKAGTTTARSMKIKAKHGKTTFYSFKVRAYKKRADGSVIYTNYSAASNGKAIYYSPNFSTFMLSEAQSSTILVGVNITNNGKFTMRVYSAGAQLIDHDYSSYDRDLWMVDHDANDISYIDIPSGGSATAYYAVKGKPTWYDSKSTIRYKIKYDGGLYWVRSSSYYGSSYYDA